MQIGLLILNIDRSSHARLQYIYVTNGERSLCQHHLNTPFGCFIGLPAMSVTFYVKAFAAIALPIYVLFSLIRDRFIKSALNNIPGPPSESFFTGKE